MSSSFDFYFTEDHQLYSWFYPCLIIQEREGIIFSDTVFIQVSGIFNCWTAYVSFNGRTNDYVGSFCQAVLLVLKCQHPYSMVYWLKKNLPRNLTLTRTSWTIALCCVQQSSFFARLLNCLLFWVLYNKSGN